MSSVFLTRNFCHKTTHGAWQGGRFQSVRFPNSGMHIQPLCKIAGQFSPKLKKSHIGMLSISQLL